MVAEVPTGRQYGKAIVGGLLGLAVVFICVVPPVLHFVTGPLGPLLGGLIGGSRAHTRGTAAAIVGLTMGIGLLVVVGLFGGIVLAVTASLPAGSGPEIGDPTTLIAVFIGFVLYTIVLGSVGALIGGRLRSRG